MSKEESKNARQNTISTKPIQQVKTITISRNSLVVVLAVIILVILAFIGGTIYQKNSNSNRLLALNQTHAYNLRRIRAHPFQKGVITNVSSSSISILNSNKKTLTYNINNLTKVKSNKQTVSITTLKNGQSVLIKPRNRTSNIALLIIIK